MCEQLNSRRTLTLPYPKFVGLKQPSEACFAFASSLLVVIRLLFRVYFCLFMFCFLYSLQLHFLVHSLKRKLMRMPKLSRSLVLSLSQSVIGAPSLSALGRAHFAHNDSDDERFSLSLCSSFATFSSSPSSYSSSSCFSSSSVSARYTCTPRSRQVLFRFVSLRLASFSALLFALGFCSRPAKNLRFSVSVRESTVHAAVANRSAPTRQKKTHRDKASKSSDYTFVLYTHIYCLLIAKSG